MSVSDHRVCQTFATYIMEQWWYTNPYQPPSRCRKFEKSTSENKYNLFYMFWGVGIFAYHSWDNGLHIRAWLYVCIHVYIYACMHVCMYVPIYVMYVCMYASMHLCIYTCMHVCMYVSTYLRIYVSTYLHIYVSMYPCIYVSTYVCIYVCMQNIRFAFINCNKMMCSNW